MSIKVAKLEELDKDDYPSWKYKIEICMHSQDLWDVVEKGYELM